MLSSGVAGGKTGFVGIVCLKPGIVGIACVAPPIPFVGAIVMELAAMTHVPDNINPTTVKPMEVSFIWYFLYRFYYRGQRAPAKLGSSTKCRCLRIRKKPRNRTNRGF